MGLFPRALASRAIPGKSIEFVVFLLLLLQLYYNLSPNPSSKVLYQLEQSRISSAHAEVHAGSRPQDLSLPGFGAEDNFGLRVVELGGFTVNPKKLETGLRPHGAGIPDT